MVAALGTFRSGAAYVPLNARDAVPDCGWFLDFAACELLFFHSAFEANLPRLRELAPRLREFVCVDRDTPSAPSLAAWSARFPAHGGTQARVPDDVAILKSTGGTTGRPKGVLQTHRCLETMYRAMEACMPVQGTPVHLLVAPLTHAAGAIAYPLMAHGARQVFAPGTDAGTILEAIERERVTHLFLPPTVIYRLLAHPDARRRDCSSLQYFIYAAAPMSVDKLKEAVAVFGPVMAQCFGQAEAPMICTYLSPAEHLGGDPAALERRLASAGRAAPFTEVAIMDDEGRILPRGDAGEIVVRGDLVMAGYFRNPEASAEASRFGWHHTGDIGRIDDEGYVTIVDRKRDMIISGGFNVYPGEVEQVLWAHPAVQDCAVVGVPDDEWGESVKAVVELKPGMEAAAEELIRLCRERLGGVKAPKSVEFWKELPRSSVGKVLKRDIRARFWAGRERRV
jgi:acyl-CoA synthetase (AMP-forming)/AMP-acid ligase II